MPAATTDAQQRQLLDELAAHRAAKEDLERREEALVRQAQAAGISSARIARQLGRSRQVLHAQYSGRERGWNDIDDPDLAAHGAYARTWTSGPEQRGIVRVEVADERNIHVCQYDGRSRSWDSRPPLPDDLVDRLAAAGDKAQVTAERRHAGRLKRDATIARDGIRVGRPPRQRR